MCLRGCGHIHQMKCPKEARGENSCNNPSWVCSPGQKEGEMQVRRDKKKDSLRVMLSQPRSCQGKPPAVQLRKTYWTKPYGAADEEGEINHPKIFLDPVIDQSLSPRELAPLHRWVYSSALIDSWRGKLSASAHCVRLVRQRFCDSSPLWLDCIPAVAAPMMGTTAALFKVSCPSEGGWDHWRQLLFSLLSSTRRKQTCRCPNHLLWSSS